MLRIEREYKMNNKIIKYVGVIITFITFVFIGKSLLSMNLDIKYISNPIFAIVLIILLSFGYAIIVFISSYAWKLTLEFIYKGKLSAREIIPVYVKSNIGKYLPGNVMHFAGRNILAGKLGFKQLDITFCTLIEILMLIFTDGILSLVFALKSFKLVFKEVFSKLNLSIVYGISIIALSLIVFIIVLLVKKTGFIKSYQHLFSKSFLKLLCKLFCIYSLTLIVPGIFLIVILKQILGCNISLEISMFIITAYTISWVSGFIVPGAPGGLGVRESVLLLILGPFYTSNIVLLAAILLRITSIIGDLLAFLVPTHSYVNKA